MKLFWIIGIVLCGTLLSAQVRVVVPKRGFRSNELIRARVVNETNEPITVCLEIGVYSMDGNDLQPTPIPFLVQAPGHRRLRHFLRKRWSSLLIVSDVGAMEIALVFSAGESKEFPFRLRDEGPRFRLVLYYWRGEKSLVCSPSPKGAKKSISGEFQLSHADISAKQ